MKSFSAIVFAGAVYVASVAAQSTVSCQACMSVSSTPDIVTRSPVPTTPCTVPALVTVASNPTATGSGASGAAGSGSSAVPVSSAASVFGKSMGAASLVALAISAMVLV